LVLRCGHESLALRDRSILLGRHIGTGQFNGRPQRVRTSVNRLFHRDYRGEPRDLLVDLDHLREFAGVQPGAFERILRYREQWSSVVNFVAALLAGSDADARYMIDSSESPVAEELQSLAWLHGNADRFSVADFWASVLGPQVACVLRNLEMVPEGLGCGHGLLGVVRID